MKKTICALLLLSMALSLVSCEAVSELLRGNTQNEQSDRTSDVEQKDPPSPPDTSDDDKEDDNNDNDEEENEEMTGNTVIEEWLKTDRERAYYDVLEGKTLNFIGDSLFAGAGIGVEYSWPNLLGEKYSMTYDNKGISGCTLSACEGGPNPIVTRYTSMPDNDPDIVVFEGGRNDYNKGSVLGHHIYKEPETFKGALAILIEGLREKYPDALIIGVTFWNATDKQNDFGYVCNDYSKAMIEVCDVYGVPCIDATDEDACGIRMTDKTFREEYSCRPSDVCHLNFEGMKLALRFFEKEIAEIYSKQ
ncbi:MAG: SGNH/GDSL hydrolase family protein [Clostridia bacterium]|nr:SGNH/GDSL hydrolase family protein [Clostridia bacterium]